MLLLLSACFTEPAPVTEPSPPTPEPKAEPTPVTKPTPKPTDTPTPTDAPHPTDSPTPTDPPEREPWVPKRPYTSKVSAPDWPDPSVHPDQCSEMEHGGEVGADGCVSAELKCGDRIVGHTVGGVTRYDSTFYEKKFCWPKTLDHDSGDERVYRLTMPPGEWRAWVTMYSPCSDLTMAAIRHQSGTCPTIDHPIRVCEMSPRAGLTTERLELTTQTPAGSDPTWYVVVEGVDDEEGMFELVVQCHPGVGGAVKKD